MTSQRKNDHKTASPRATITEHGQKSKRNAKELTPSNSFCAQALRQFEAGNYQKALEHLEAAGREPRIRNARGVCFLRLGRYADAIRVLRELVLASGGTWVRPGTPAAYTVNYATALFLGGHPAGCLDILADLNDEKLHSVTQLRSALRTWEKSLSIWQRLNWQLGGIEPQGRRPTIDFLPGELDFDLPGADDSVSPDPKFPPARSAA